MVERQWMYNSKQINKRTTDDRVHENVGPGIQSPLIIKCIELASISVTLASH